MTARFSGGDKEPEEVGIDTPTQHGGDTDGKGGDFGEGLSIEDAFGNKFMEVVDLIKPEDIVEKCWKGYTKKGLKKKGKKMVPNCVPVGEEKDHEVSMAQAQLDKSAKNIKDLKKKLGTKEKNIPAWVQAKITDTEHNTDAAAGYTNKEETEMQEAKVDKLKPEHERASARDKRYDNPTGALELGGGIRRARRIAHRERDEMNKDKKDVRRGKTGGPQFQGKTGAERLAKVKSELGEAVRLPSEFGHIMAVVVMWRGKSYHIRMFFPQAKMPTKKEAQLEIEKVYPGGKVLSVVRNDLPSQFAPINSPLFKVTKEEKEVGCPKCAGKCGKGCECECHEEEVEEAAGEKDACYKKVKSRYSVWPSAYASGALSKCRKVGADNWGNKKEEVDRLGKSEISEKMNLAKADMGDVIKDFRDSDAPQFKGKSDKKIRQMAIAAKLEAERGEQKEDWQKVNRKDKTDGLSQKAVNAYRKENPGSKLKTAVTTKPSKLKKGSKDAKRRSSFCSRMKGMKKRLTSAKTSRDPDSRINKALRRWNCN